MIRINLLPIKQDRRREAGRNQIIIGLCVVAVEIAICFVINMNISADIEEQNNKNDIVEADVNRINDQIKDHEKILGEIAEFEKRQAAINSLQEARTGPVHVMLELSEILSKGGRPHVNNERYQEMILIDPASGYDEDWDYRNVWVSGFSEKNRVVKIKGQALTHEDVAEFLRRINLSDFFVSSKLISTDLSGPSIKGRKIDKKAEPVVHFSVDGTVRYR